MTVDASRSCLGLGTCIGSAIRQIVLARVLPRVRAPSLARKLHVWVARWRLLLWIRSRSFSDQPAVTVTWRAMAQTKPDSSRAIAVVTTLAGLPARASRR